MTSSPFDPFIMEKGFVLLDGGLATELEEQVSAKNGKKLHIFTCMHTDR